MRFAATKKNIYNSFDKIIDFFSLTFFGNYVDGEEFLHDFGAFLDNTKFPTDKIVINPFYGYKNEFAITFKYNEEKVTWIKFEMNEYTKLIKITSTLYTDKNIQKMFQNVIDNFIDKYNTEIIQKQVNKCDITKIIVDDYKDYKHNGTQITLKGTLTEMFDTYTTHNDKLRYCNGEYWKFNDQNVQLLYAMFVQNYKGNYFLHNAVKRGCIID
jgi:tRNA/tmRNA/rRNA uracil-C5-methylase (TrmA/RlmC/RlmD family)